MTRLSRKNGKKFQKMARRRHLDMTQKETLPDASKQFEKMRRELATLKKRVSTLEAQVQPIYAERLEWKQRQRQEKADYIAEYGPYEEEDEDDVPF